jgi:hypothetical protein
LFRHTIFGAAKILECNRNTKKTGKNLQNL